MTVAELIEKLKAVPQNGKVYLSSANMDVEEVTDLVGAHVDEDGDCIISVDCDYDRLAD